MSTLVHVLETALPVFVTLGLGMLCRGKKLLSREAISGLKNIAVNITLPAVMFSAFATAEYTAKSLTIPLIMFALCLVAFFLGKVICKGFKIQGKLSPFLSTGFEAGMLGYGLFALLFGTEANSSFAIVDLGQVLFVFTVYKIALSGKSNWRDCLKEAVLSPTVWAIAVGVLFGATGLYEAMPQTSGILSSVATFIAAPTSAIILITIGYDLEPREIRWRSTIGIVAMRLILMGVLLAGMLLLNRYVLNGMIHTGALVLMMTLPPPYVLPVFADAPEERANLSSALSVLTLISLLLFAAETAIFA